MTQDIGYLTRAFEDFTRIYCPEDSINEQLNKFVERHPSSAPFQEFIRTKVESARG